MSASIQETAFRHRYVIAFTVTLASMLELLDTSIVNVALPDMMGNLGASLDEIAWVLTGYVVANAIVIPASGWLSGLLGRKRYFASSVALFTVSSFFCGNAHSLTALVLWRILQGLGGGAFLATAQATLYEVFPPEEFGVAQAIFGMGVVVGPTLGPTLGGYITDTASWHWIFFINVPLGIAAFVLTLVYVPDSPFVQRKARVDLWGLALLVIGIGTLQMMLDRGERQDWFNSAEITAYAVLAATALIALVWHELTTEHPIVDFRVLKNPQLAAGVMLAFLLGVSLYATIFVLPVYLQTLLGYSAWQTGLVLLPGALATAAMNGTMAKLTRRVDNRLLVGTGIVIFAISMHSWSLFTTESGMSDFFWPLIVRGIGLGFIFVPLSNLALAALPKTELNQGSGLYNLTRQLGGSLGIAVAATLLTRFRVIDKARLAEHITLFDAGTTERLAAIARGMMARGMPEGSARQAAVAALDGIVTRQAAMIAIERVFLLFGVAFLIALPLLLMMRKTRGGAGAGAAH
ncbi:MAG TPA: DHA2 family efflux MFS transporter permease subunit [Longimicrobiaceae bacterium]|nr:DHA2 family efflux MFS transporter permease subunit [Longimicrobiaceae bacterium]